jgi:hypothetical protein
MIKTGDITNKIIKTGTVDTTIVGTYKIIYSVKDANGNEASLTRTIKVKNLNNSNQLNNTNNDNTINNNVINNNTNTENDINNT